MNAKNNTGHLLILTDVKLTSADQEKVVAIFKNASVYTDCEMRNEHAALEAVAEAANGLDRILSINKHNITGSVEVHKALANLAAIRGQKVEGGK